MSPNIFKLKSKVWVYPGKAVWRFISVQKKESTQIKKLFGDLARGWGSLPVKVTVGCTEWQTSIFPDKKRGEYLLPLKAEVRKKEKILDGKITKFQLEILI